MEPGSIQHSGYLTPGDEINVQGGFTVDFQKKYRRYWILQYFGEGNLILNGYKDEKSFRKSSSSSTNTKTSTLGRQRKISSAPVDTIRLMTSLKVHKLEMKTRKKVENVLVVVSGSHPKFFRPDNKEELDEWHRVLMKFASDTRSIKRRDRRGKTHPEQQPQESLNLERDSGISTSYTRSTCDSQRSSSSSVSSVSSEEMNEESSDRKFPMTMSFDLDDEEHSTSPLPSPSLRESAGSQRGSSSRRSVFFRNKYGNYEERTTSLSRESTESGFYDGLIPRNVNEESRPDSVYDVLPPSSFHVNDNLHHNDHSVLPVKQLRASKHSSSSLDYTDSSIPEEVDREAQDITHRLAETWGTRLEISPELQQVLNDDGTTHTYVNQRLPPNSSSPLASPRVPARPPVLPPRKNSLSAVVSETEYSKQVVQGSRRRTESMPVDIGLQDTADHKYSPRSSPVPIPEAIPPYSDIEALKAQQEREEVEVQIDKLDLDDSIALVDIKGRVIVAGWKRGIYGKLHVGDQLVQVNDQVVSQSELANTFIKTSCRAKIVLHVNRLPFAKIVNCTKIHEDTLWGIECKANEISHLRSGPVKEAGLTEKSESSAFSKKSCEWIITEAANKPIRLDCPKDEMMQYLATKDLELPLVVHPKDFIQDLKKALNKLKRSSFYYVG